jgi:hypothetical protein
MRTDLLSNRTITAKPHERKTRTRETPRSGPRQSRRQGLPRQRKNVPPNSGVPALNEPKQAKPVGGPKTRQDSNGSRRPVSGLNALRPDLAGVFPADRFQTPWLLGLQRVRGLVVLGGIGSWGLPSMGRAYPLQGRSTRRSGDSRASGNNPDSPGTERPPGSRPGREDGRTLGSVRTDARCKVAPPGSLRSLGVLKGLE